LVILASLRPASSLNQIRGRSGIPKPDSAKPDHALSSTMFIILDMDLPYEGLFKISSQTMRTALSDMLR
jgi:hypothetical protein